jgi:hypothetical protein
MNFEVQTNTTIVFLISYKIVSYKVLHTFKTLYVKMVVISLVSSTFGSTCDVIRYYVYQS